MIRAKVYFDTRHVSDYRQYIEREYKIANNHLMLTSEQNVKVIERKAKKVRGM